MELQSPWLELQSPWLTSFQSFMELQSPWLTSFQGAGIQNMNETCYMSAILQGLTHTELLFSGLRDIDHQHCQVDGFCVICALRSHIHDAFLPARNTIVPIRFSSNLKHFSTDFELGKQADAHEFLCFCLEKLSLCLLNQYSFLVDEVFCGYYRDECTCSICGNNSFSDVESFNHVSLDIRNHTSLRDALRSFTLPKDFEGRTCSFCGTKGEIKKCTFVRKAPHSLILHLLRFDYHGMTGKIVDHVGFEYNLDIQPVMFDNASQHYRLYAVVVHRGSSANVGHYLCYLCPVKGKCYLMDDDRVSEVSQDEVLKQPAYLLFYVRK